MFTFSKAAADRIMRAVLAIERLTNSVPQAKGPRGSAGVRFSGVAYVRGVKFENLDSDSSKPWVKVDVSAGTAVEDAGPPPNPFPDNTEFFEKAQTAGAIHVMRFG